MSFPSETMVQTISVTDFPAQIAQCNAIRATLGLPLLNQEQAIKAAIHVWNTLLDEARARLRERAGHDLANNAFTFLIVSREAAPKLQTYFEDLARPSDGPESHSGRR